MNASLPAGTPGTHADIETRAYGDGSTATGPGPLPALSPEEQAAAESPYLIALLPRAGGTIRSTRGLTADQAREILPVLRRELGLLAGQVRRAEMHSGVRTHPFDAAPVLDTPEARTDYIIAAAETGDPAELAQAYDAVERALMEQQAAALPDVLTDEQLQAVTAVAADPPPYLGPQGIAFAPAVELDKPEARADFLAAAGETGDPVELARAQEVVDVSRVIEEIGALDFGQAAEDPAAVVALAPVMAAPESLPLPPHWSPAFTESVKRAWAAVCDSGQQFGLLSMPRDLTDAERARFLLAWEDMVSRPNHQIMALAVPEPAHEAAFPLINAIVRAAEAGELPPLPGPQAPLLRRLLDHVQVEASELTSPPDMDAGMAAAGLEWEATLPAGSLIQPLGGQEAVTLSPVRVRSRQAITVVEGRAAEGSAAARDWPEAPPYFLADAVERPLRLVAVMNHEQWFVAQEVIAAEDAEAAALALAEAEAHAEARYDYDAAGEARVIEEAHDEPDERAPSDPDCRPATAAEIAERVPTWAEVEAERAREAGAAQGEEEAQAAPEGPREG